MNLKKAKRIMIIGQPGSGKSTLARQLGEKLCLPVVHIDRIHWCAGWIERNGPDKDRLCSEVHARELWIFEGGRSSTWPERLSRADALIWLDFPFHVRAWRVFCRTLKYHGKSRPDLPEGCPEHFNREFALWIWNTRKSNRRVAEQLYESAGKDKLRLCNVRSVTGLVAAL